MENITEWAGNIGKDARNKPSAQLQAELFEHIKTALQENGNAYEACVAAFCRFDAKVITPFYRDCYWTDVPDRAKWDEAFFKWADSKKPTVSATIRMALILQEKLKRAEGSSDVLPELRWFSLHEDARSASAFKGLRDHSEQGDLRKLLDLDMRDWKIGQPAVLKMYGVLFSDASDAETQERYRAFQARHGIAEKESVSAEQQPAPPLEHATEIARESVSSDDAWRTAQDTAPDAAAEPEKAKDVSVNDTAVVDETAPKTGDHFKDGIALAEALLKWARSQTECQLDLRTRLSDKEAETARLAKQEEEMSARTAALKSELILVKNENAALKQQLAKANETCAALEAEKNAAQETIGRVQMMSDNSVKQEMDGFKHELACALSRTVKDFSGDNSDLTDAEKVEVYAALIEELLDTLKHNGIVMEEH